jgi:hypothetical protein
MVMQWTVNPPPSGTTGSIPVVSTKLARSYKGYYFGLSIRLWEFDSPTSRQIAVYGSGLSAWSHKPRIAGSNPATATKPAANHC